MKGTKSSIRYAKALLELCVEQGKLDDVLKDMEFFHNAGKDNYDLLVFLKSPVINSDKKIKVFNELFSHFNSLSKAFLHLITKNGREYLLPLIADSFIELVKQHKGIVSATLVSSTKLSEESKKKILSKIKIIGNLEVNEVVDSGLIGGFIVRVGDIQVDASVSSQLKKLKLDLIQNN